MFLGSTLPSTRCTPAEREQSVEHRPHGLPGEALALELLTQREPMDAISPSASRPTATSPATDPSNSMAICTQSPRTGPSCAADSSTSWMAFSIGYGQLPVLVRDVRLVAVPVHTRRRRPHAWTGS